MFNGNATLWHVAGVLVSILAVVIAYEYSVIAAVAFWLVMTFVLLVLRPE